MPKKENAANHVSLGERQAVFTVERYHRYWKVSDPDGELVCVTVYKRGAKEVVRRLEMAAT